MEMLPGVATRYLSSARQRHSGSGGDSSRGGSGPDLSVGGAGKGSGSPVAAAKERRGSLRPWTSTVQSAQSSQPSQSQPAQPPQLMVVSSAVPRISATSSSISTPPGTATGTAAGPRRSSPSVVLPQVSSASASPRASLSGTAAATRFRPRDVLYQSPRSSGVGSLLAAQQAEQANSTRRSDDRGLPTLSRAEGQPRGPALSREDLQDWPISASPANEDSDIDWERDEPVARRKSSGQAESQASDQHLDDSVGGRYSADLDESAAGHAAEVEEAEEPEDLVQIAAENDQEDEQEDPEHHEGYDSDRGHPQDNATSEDPFPLPDRLAAEWMSSDEEGDRETAGLRAVPPGLGRSPAADSPSSAPAAAADDEGTRAFHRQPSPAEAAARIQRWYKKRAAILRQQNQEALKQMMQAQKQQRREHASQPKDTINAKKAESSRHATESRRWDSQDHGRAQGRHDAQLAEPAQRPQLAADTAAPLRREAWPVDLPQLTVEQKSGAVESRSPHLGKPTASSAPSTVHEPAAGSSNDARSGFTTLSTDRLAAMKAMVLQRRGGVASSTSPDNAAMRPSSSVPASELMGNAREGLHSAGPKSEMRAAEAASREQSRPTTVSSPPLSAKDRLEGLLSEASTAKDLKAALEVRPSRNVHLPPPGFTGRRPSLLGDLDQLLEAAIAEKPPVSPPPTVKLHAQTVDEVGLIIQQQRSELAARSQLVEALQRQLEEQRQMLASLGDAPETIRVLKAENSEKESAIQRHLGFVDQLLKDKQALTARCEALAKQMDDVVSKFTHQLQAEQHKAKTELAQQLELLRQKEKDKRVKWLQAQTQHIKEATVKGLEPEIQRLITQHKTELQRMEAVHAQELARIGGSRAELQEREIQEVRREMEAEQRRLVAREAQLCRDKYQAQLEEEERTFQQQRRQWQAELEAERKRHEQQRQEERAQWETELKERLALESKNTAALRAEAEERLERQQEAHAKALQDLRTQLNIERESWEDMFMRKQEGLLKTKEAAIREELRLARDREIELAISRLEETSAQETKAMEEQMKERIRKMQEKCDIQLRDAEKAERTALAKFTECKQQLAETAAELATVKGQMAQMERDLSESQGVVARLQRERDRVSDVIRVEFAERLAATEAEVEAAQKAFREEKLAHRASVQELESQKEAELDAIHAKVKNALDKKDETIRALREQLQAATVRADHIEALFSKQREQLLNVGVEPSILGNGRTSAAEQASTAGNK